MTPREAVLNVIRHSEVRPVPYTLPFDGDVADAIEKRYGSAEWRGRIAAKWTRAGCSTREVGVECLRVRTGGASGAGCRDAMMRMGRGGKPQSEHSSCRAVVHSHGVRHRETITPSAAPHDVISECKQ